MDIKICQVKKKKLYKPKVEIIINQPLIKVERGKFIVEI